jgi:OOP family OmpA-OmpF porin
MKKSNVLNKVFLLLIALGALVGNAQNLVHNASFEHKKHCPEKLGDFPCLKWSSPFVELDPDYFSQCSPKGSPMNIEGKWLNIQPYNGKSYIGMVLVEDESDYREYLGSRLIESLIKDTTYVFRIAIAQPNYARWTIGQLGLMITENKLEDYKENYFLREPSIIIPTEGKNFRSEWQYLEFEYKALGDERYITLGNYRKDKQSEVELIVENKNLDERTLRSLYNQAYYLFDGLSLEQKYKHKPHITFVKRHHGNSDIHDLLITKFVFNNLNFDTDSSAIASHELSSLDTVVTLMNQHPEYHINITGHTDDRGGSSDNLKLSKQRAQTLSHYLLSAGIKESRIKVIGKGEAEPVNIIGSVEGRRANRRIEIEFFQ